MIPLAALIQEDFRTNCEMNSDESGAKFRESFKFYSESEDISE